MMMLFAFLVFSQTVSADGSLTDIYTKSFALAEQTYQQGADAIKGLPARITETVTKFKMNCAYHNQNAAVVQCNGCGKPLCPGCDHRIKGFPYCQDCIVQGVDLLRQQNRTSYAPFIKKRTSPFIALILSFICPGLGAAYNGQTVKP
jgi:hypothetical protein